MSIGRIKEQRCATGRNRASRPKTFKTEDAAKAYADKNKIKSYTLEVVSMGKIRIVEN